jgi:photosystem II stability/assembly factor-like uncharacterized protein
MVIGTDFGVFGTEDHGQSWVELTSTLGSTSGAPERPTVEAVAFDPSDSRRIYAGTFNHGIIVTDDRGQTWRFATRNLGVKAIAVDPGRPHDVFAAATDWSSAEHRSGVIVSHDRGATWSWSLQTRDGLTALAAAPQGLFAAGPTNVAPYVVRFDWRDGSYGSSFASYLMEGTLRGLATSPQGDSVVALNSGRSQTDVVILRIAR